MKKPTTKGKGRIQVTIQREDRLAVISTLAETVKLLAVALTQPPEINISGNTLSSIKIDWADDVTRTEIKEVLGD